MATTPEQIINQALIEARRTRRIADIYEGSQEAVIALELYGQARDELLDLRDWSFSRRVTPLTLLKGPPPNGGYGPSPGTPWSSIYPYPGFLYEYAYPADCVDVRAVIAPPQSMPDLDPLQELWRVDNDPTPIVSGNPPVASGPPAKVIFTNQNSALIVYRARVTDPASFDVGFTSSLVALLAKRFGEAFGENVEALRQDLVEATSTAAAASSLRG